MATEKVRPSVLENDAYLLLKVVLRRLCLDFGPHLHEPFPMGRFH